MTNGRKKVKAALLSVIIVTAIITCINPVGSVRQMCLQHIGTMLLMIPLLYDTIKNRMPMFAFVGVTFFVLLHIVGARYIYSFVPYREWSISLGVPADYWGIPADYQGDITVFFEEHCKELRNHYDRLVHFSFGLLMFPYLLYISRKWVAQKLLVAILVAWLLVQTGSMIYEIFEWLLSFTCSQDMVEKYNGQQGDMWDAQKDMALAMVGSTLMAIFHTIKGRRRKPMKKLSEFGVGCV